MSRNSYTPGNPAKAKPSAIGGMMAGDAILNSAYDERITMRAWESLLEGRVEPARSSLPVRSAINDSWHRCASGGIDAQRNEAPIETDKDAVEALARSSSELLAAAARPFEAIGKLLNGTGAMLMLADGEGVLIDAIGDKKTIYDGMDIHLGVGGKWTEDVVGTNGIGTALWTGEPVFVHAAEHFCAGIKAWTCAGAPIRDPFDGKVIGVVDLSGHPDIFRPHNIALVTAAAREIERALADSQNEERMRLLEAFIASVGNYRSKDGVMIIDRHGRAIYSNNVPIAERTRFGDAIRQGSSICRLPELSNSGFLDSVATALPRDMRSWHVCPLELDGDVRGAALVFPKTDDGRTVLIGSRTTSQRLKDECALIIGESEALRKAVEIACKIGESADVTSLLIEGETGVGKELFARLIHSASRKSANGPFIALNCGAITKELFGSELFGHVGGAFTGASREGKPGVFEHADGGVLSLDEIGEMPMDMQPFLLRVLEERAVTRLGDNRLRPVDVRLVASTNRNLKAEVENGRFRKDLFYRVSTVSIRVPPLRDRGSDSLVLIEHFNRKLAERKGSAPLRFSNRVLDALLAYRWPGNVRELRNLVERLHLLSFNGFVDIHDLPGDLLEPSQGPMATSLTTNAAPDAEPPIFSFEDAERQAIKNALVAEHGNLSKVAQRLGISRPTLYRKLAQFGIRRGFV
ncbi:sigma-54-dependent Fis family transcriptional regulator [Pararhizobium sp. BT-229]|uniref:sigma-54-dependent Fis family transcriptional regulator n=1 Tax=Pararhizobium sp. BT-229 TaxID=2986923 RepID=UPI0021F71205|nr:sigma-54-dependent Fis family transcriptional regulator [Pararhizobium sp. BT-229]MCV9963198.1 sigma-54-dependent Fis family transcriptional regulator [Pararhizobium sp. BT-229]